jgi:hypothetical protein
MSFWLKFAIQEAITLAQVFVAQTTLKPSLKNALEALITAGEAVITEM